MPSCFEAEVPTQWFAPRPPHSKEETDAKKASGTTQLPHERSPLLLGDAEKIALLICLDLRQTWPANPLYTPQSYLVYSD
eukprot:6312013-Amphidinium_carterae.1